MPLSPPHLVLTAAHCLFNHRRGRAPVQIRIIPGRMDRDHMPFGHIDSREYYVPKGYINHRFSRHRHRFDYGIIRLPRPFNPIKHFMPVAALSDPLLKQIQRRGKVTVAGYPGDRPVGTLWKHSEFLKKLTRWRLHYTMDTCPGHSGSPIWTIHPRTQRRTIIGVHTSGVVDEWGHAYGCSHGTVMAPTSAVNSGVRITPHVLASIRHPCDQSGRGQPLVRLP